jgi:hydroxylysine kinase
LRNSISDTLKSVAADPPNLDTVDVANAVAEQYGLVGTYAALVSERDQNFKLTTEAGDRYVVKIVCTAEETTVTDFQIAALLHLENKGFSGVPRIVRTKSDQGRGAILADDGSMSCLRLVTWLSGELLAAREPSENLATQLGHRLADLDLALEDFDHQGDRQVLLWDIQRAGNLRKLSNHIGDGEIRRRVVGVLDDFASCVSPALAGLCHQVIHNDVNPDNVLLNDSGAVFGVIDFGDMMRAPRVIELSTAASYLRSEKPLQYILPLITAYCSRNPLEEREVGHLYDLIRARLAMTLSILFWRLSAREPGDPYREKSLAVERDAYDFLIALESLGREHVSERLKESVLVS